MNLENLIVSSAEVKLSMTVGANIFDLLTGVSLSISKSQDISEIFAIGQYTPIGLKTLNRRFNGSLSIQIGEYETLIDAINGTRSTGFIGSLQELKSFSLGWTLEMSGLVTPKTIIYSLDSCKISTDDMGIDRNSPETNVSLQMQGIGISRNVALM